MYPTSFTLFVGFALLATPTHGFADGSHLSSNGTITGVIPQCQGLCDTYNNLVATCDSAPAQGVPFEQCECTDDNFKIIEACFNCEAAAGGTEPDRLQADLNNLVLDCNDRLAEVTTIAPQTIVASTFAVTGGNTVGDPTIVASNSVFKSASTGTASASVPTGTGVASSSSNDASRVTKGLLSLAVGGGLFLFGTLV